MYEIYLMIIKVKWDLYASESDPAKTLWINFGLTNIYYFSKPAETDSLRWESKDINQTIIKTIKTFYRDSN